MENPILLDLRDFVLTKQTDEPILVLRNPVMVDGAMGTNPLFPLIVDYPPPEYSSYGNLSAFFAKSPVIEIPSVRIVLMPIGASSIKVVPHAEGVLGFGDLGTFAFLNQLILASNCKSLCLRAVAFESMQSTSAHPVGLFQQLNRIELSLKLLLSVKTMKLTVTRTAYQLRLVALGSEVPLHFLVVSSLAQHTLHYEAVASPHQLIT